MTIGPKLHQTYHDSLKDTPQKMLHPNYGAPAYRTSREAFGRSLPYDDEPKPIPDFLKAWGIFLAIVAVFALIAFFIHPHWKP